MQIIDVISKLSIGMNQMDSPTHFRTTYSDVTLIYRAYNWINPLIYLK